LLDTYAAKTLTIRVLFFYSQKRSRWSWRSTLFGMTLSLFWTTWTIGSSQKRHVTLF